MAAHANTPPEVSEIERGEVASQRDVDLPEGMLDMVRSCRDGIPNDWRNQNQEMLRLRTLAVMSAGYDGTSAQYSKWYDQSQQILAAEADGALEQWPDNVIPIVRGRAPVAEQVTIGNVAGMQ